MFKVICKIQKMILDNQIVAINRYDCIPCEFSDYQMFDDNNYSLKKRTDYMNDVAFFLELTSLNISKPEYHNLANKIYYLDDLTDYRYIGLFDDSTKVQNVHNFGIPWIYSAIIRHMTPDYTSMLINSAWESVYSLFSNTPQNEQDEKENFKTIWEKQFLFSLPASVTTHRLKGTIEKSAFKDGTGKQYYGINTYFLKHLLSGKQNSKCEPINNKLAISYIEDSVQSPSDRIYDEFKANLPKLFGLKYLEFLDEYRSCKSVYYNYKSTTMFLDNRDKFTLTPVLHKQPFNQLIMISCKELGGYIVPLFGAADRFKESCAKSPELVDFEAVLNHMGTNELYAFNCNTLNETIEAVGNISDFYIY